jgi:hypothetical protein
MPRSSHSAWVLALASSVTIALPRAVAAQSWTDKLSIHGYLTQGVAKSDTGIVIGIPKDGTAEYRRVALLLRYAATTHDRLVLEFASRELGVSPSQALQPDVNIEWAFYEHQFGSSTTKVRVGEIPIPIGIYNEIRYVGTLLPFYRPPYEMYGEGNFTSETMDGISVSHTFLTASQWPLEAQGYAGTFKYLLFATIPDSTGKLTYTGGQALAQDVLGGQLWLSTPVDGLRVGAGGMRYTSVGIVFLRPGEKGSETTWQLSVDGNFDRFQARAEYGRFIAGVFTQPRYYVQAGVRVWGPVTVNGQLEYQNQKDTDPNSPFDIAYDRDRVIGVNCAVSSNIVVKLEAHFTKGYNFEMPVNTQGPPITGRYGIASLSMTF